MSPGFFLCLAESTGDGFAYVVLPCTRHKDISLYRNPVTLVRCVVRSRDLASSNAPRCIKDDKGFTFTTHDGVELLGEEELIPDFDGLDFDEGPDLEESTSEEHLQSSSPTPSSHSFLSVDIQGLSPLVEEDSLLVND